jgi:hypothetical protein
MPQDVYPEHILPLEREDVCVVRHPVHWDVANDDVSIHSFLCGRITRVFWWHATAQSQHSKPLPHCLSWGLLPRWAAAGTGGKLTCLSSRSHRMLRSGMKKTDTSCRVSALQHRQQSGCSRAQQ